MPIFELQTPDGRTFEVDAPDMNAATAAVGSMGKKPTTVADWWPIFNEMRGESQNQIGKGIEQLKSGFMSAATPSPEGMTPEQKAAGGVSMAKGAGNVALGAAGFIGSPIAAGLRTLIGKPLEEQTGLPKEYSELAAGLALPIPKRIGLPSRSKPTGLTSEEVLGAARDTYKTLPGNEILRPAVAPKTFGVLEEVGLKAPEPASRIEALIDARRSLHDLKVSPDLTERAAAQRGIPLIDKEIESIDPSVLAKLREADANWAAGRTMEKLERQGERARVKSESPTGPTADTALRQRARAILDNDKARLGLTEDEIIQLEKINAGTYIGNAAGWLASLLRGKGSASTALQATGIAPAVARGMEAIAGKITRNQFAKLQEMVSARSPAGRAAEASTKAWSEAKEAFELDPSVKAFVKLSITSRNLSNTLKPAGINIDPSSLLRPVRGSAEEEQPNP